MFPESFGPLVSGAGNFMLVPNSDATTIIDTSDGVAEAQAARKMAPSVKEPAKKKATKKKAKKKKTG